MADPDGAPQVGEWEIKMSSQHKCPYFFRWINKDEKKYESSWIPPDGVDMTTLKGYAEHVKPGTVWRQDAADDDDNKDSRERSGKIRASHILVKHRDSRNPKSWKSHKKLIETSKEDAIKEIEGYQAQILACEDAQSRKKMFGELAETASHCASHANQGDLGPFGRGAMQKPFEDAAFALDIGEMSPIVSTDSGVHLIMRTE